MPRPRDAICSHLLGTADPIAQMADRCYLEKCRDRLYKEFVLGGVAVERASPGEFRVRYSSGIDLLRKTPVFYQEVSRNRLCNKFNHAYRYVEVLYDGQNPYTDAIRNNMSHLLRILKTGDWSLLRRSPALFVGDDDAIRNIEQMVHTQLAAIPHGPGLTASRARVPDRAVVQSPVSDIEVSDRACGARRDFGDIDEASPLAAHDKFDVSSTRVFARAVVALRVPKLPTHNRLIPAARRTSLPCERQSTTRLGKASRRAA